MPKAKIKFWNELKFNPNLNILHKLGFEITTIEQFITAIWKQLTELYLFHHPTLVVYLNFLRLVTGYYDEATKVEQILNKEQWQGSETKELTYAAIFSMITPHGLGVE